MCTRQIMARQRTLPGPCYTCTRMIRHVIWDWNGTLLDDVEHAVSALNLLLQERGMPTIDRAHYLANFGFPVRDFYVGLGFDFAAERFEDLSHRFIAHYKTAAQAAAIAIHSDAIETMATLQALNIQQSVLSAMEKDMLAGMLHDYGLTPYLQHVRGLDDLHASSKIALGVELMRLLALSLAPHEILFVGDTLHDYETAAAMGCQVLLFALGHQTPDRLRQSGAQVIHSLRGVVDFVRAEQAGLP
jgi:phosphoglycolate phosphatase